MGLTLRAVVRSLQPVAPKRDRAADRRAEVCTEVRALSAALIAAVARLPVDERDATLEPILATDRALLEALGDHAGPGSFAEVRGRLVARCQAQPARGRLAWHGGPMTVQWALHNRLAVTWAALDRCAERTGSARPGPSRPIIELALELLPHSFLRAGRAVPEGAVAVDVDAPDGTRWHLASPHPADWPAPNDRVCGPALDLCRVACGRVARGATGLVAEGEVADAWLDVIDALAYSDPPG
jgi:hypothetical protein